MTFRLFLAYFTSQFYPQIVEESQVTISLHSHHGSHKLNGCTFSSCSKILLFFATTLKFVVSNFLNVTKHILLLWGPKRKGTISALQSTHMVLDSKWLQFPQWSRPTKIFLCWHFLSCCNLIFLLKGFSKCTPKELLASLQQSIMGETVYVSPFPRPLCISKPWSKLLC